MTARAVRTPEYTELLAKALPAVIHCEKEYERLLRSLEELERRRDRLSAAEQALSELLGVLIEKYEDEHYPIREATPVEVLKALMEANNLKQKDLLDVFGAESTVSAVLRGKRQFSKRHIQRLSERFNLSPEAFF